MQIRAYCSKDKGIDSNSLLMKSQTALQTKKAGVWFHSSSLQLNGWKAKSRPFRKRGNHTNRQCITDLFRGESETTAQADLSVGRLLLPNPSANLVSCNKRDDNSHLCHIRGFFCSCLRSWWRGPLLTAFFCCLQWVEEREHAWSTNRNLYWYRLLQ